jgi:hypothetical protein
VSQYLGRLSLSSRAASVHGKRIALMIGRCEANFPANKTHHAKKWVID